MHPKKNLRGILGRPSTSIRFLLLAMMLLGSIISIAASVHGAAEAKASPKVANHRVSVKTSPNASGHHVSVKPHVILGKGKNAAPKKVDRAFVTPVGTVFNYTKNTSTQVITSGAAAQYTVNFTNITPIAPGVTNGTFDNTNFLITDTIVAVPANPGLTVNSCVSTTPKYTITTFAATPGGATFTATYAPGQSDNTAVLGVPQNLTPFTYSCTYTNSTANPIVVQNTMTVASAGNTFNPTAGAISDVIVNPLTLASPSPSPVVSPSPSPSPSPVVSPSPSPVASPIISVIKQAVGHQEYEVGDRVRYIILVKVDPSSPVSVNQTVTVTDILDSSLRDIHVGGYLWSIDLSDTNGPALLTASYTPLTPILPGQALPVLYVSGILNHYAIDDNVDTGVVCNTANAAVQGASQSSTACIFVYESDDTYKGGDDKGGDKGHHHDPGHSHGGHESRGDNNGGNGGNGGNGNGGNGGNGGSSSSTVGMPSTGVKPYPTL